MSKQRQLQKYIKTMNTEIHFIEDYNTAYYYEGKVLIAVLNFNTDEFECYDEELSKAQQDYIYKEMTSYSDDYKSELKSQYNYGFNF